MIVENKVSRILKKYKIYENMLFFEILVGCKTVTIIEYYLLPLFVLY